jgi:hypothetical protein
MDDRSHTEQALAKLKSNRTPGNVAAVLVGENTPPGLDGVQWRFFVCDGNTTAYLNATISGSSLASEGGLPDEGELERRVELAALTFPLDSRMADLLAVDPLSIAG